MAFRRDNRKGIIAVALALLLVSSGGVRAVDFAGGTGEPNDPYQIATAEQLIGMADDASLLDKHFILMADIDVDPSLPGRRIFQGAIMQGHMTRLRYESYGGHFEGNGHAIRNLTIYRGDDGVCTGLFCSIDEQGSVSNLRLENVLVVDGGGPGSYCGALAGANAGAVVHCTVTGTVVASPGSLPGGGLIGRNAGFVVDCHAQCYVFGGTVGGLIGANEEPGRIVFGSSDGTVVGYLGGGGLVGTNEGLIQYSSATGSVLGPGSGGLVGDNGGTVRESCAATFTSRAGLIGTNSGIVLNCYATGTVSSEFLQSTPGGLVGSNGGTIISSYCTTVLDVPGAEPQPLPLGATSASGGDARRCYYLVTEKPVNVGRRGGRSPRTDGTRLAEEMQQRASLPGLDFYGDPNDGVEDHWFMPENGYPILTWQADLPGVAGIPDLSGLSPERAHDLLRWAGLMPGAVCYDYAHLRRLFARSPLGWRGVSTEGETLYTRPSHYALPGDPVEIVVSLGPYDFSENAGDGTEANPYQIETAGQLDTLLDQEDLWTRHFILMADINLTHQRYSDALIGRFSGTFDGSGHSLRYAGGNGLFGIVEAGAVVRDLVLEQSLVSAEWDSDQIGLLAGTNKGEITDCAAAGRVFGGDFHVGGLVGWNDGQIARCTIDTRVFGGSASDIGGLVGHNAGEVVNCCARGVVRPEAGGYAVGGLIGENAGYVARCCAQEIRVSAVKYAGGLVGVNRGTGKIENSYARGLVEGTDHLGGLVGVNDGAVREEDAILPVVGEVATVLNCYAACSVTGQSEVGGCVGDAPGVAVQEGCYFLDASDGGGPDNGYGLPLLAGEMRQQAGFVGWDFQTVWMICEGTDYPRLQWEEIVCEE